MITTLLEASIERWWKQSLPELRLRAMPSTLLSPPSFVSLPPSNFFFFSLIFSGPKQHNHPNRGLLAANVIRETEMRVFIFHTALGGDRVLVLDIAPLVVTEFTVLVYPTRLKWASLWAKQAPLIWALQVIEKLVCTRKVVIGKNAR